MAVRPESRPFTVEEYEAMASAGILDEDDRVELINGTITQMTPIGSRHQACVDRLTRILSRALEDRAILRVQGPVTLNDLSQPQPDISIIRNRSDFYAAAHPGPGDTLLMIEVADSSLPFDRNVKAPLYASAGVLELWIVDLAGKLVEDYRRPGAEGYAEHRQISDPDEPLLVAALPDLAISVKDILGDP